MQFPPVRKADRDQASSLGGTAVALGAGMALKNALLTTPLLLLLACGGNDLGPDGSGVGDPSGGGGSDVTSSTRVDGTYEVTSSYDLTSSSALPPVIGNVILPLSNLADDPAGTIIQIIQGTDTPAADIVDKIPAALLGIFSSLANSFIQNQLFNDQPVLAQVANYTSLVASILTDFDIVTELEVQAADDAGNATAKHKLVAFAFGEGATRVVIDSPAILGNLDVANDVSVNVDVQARTIDIGDHSLQLPLGDVAVYGLNAAIAATTEYENLGEALVGAVDCPALAAEVGPLCIGPVCLADEPAIAGLCVTGLNLVASEVERQIKNIDIAHLHMVGGTASVVAESKSDSGGSNAVSAMNSGNWDTEFALGETILPMQSMFEARRMQ